MLRAARYFVMVVPLFTLGSTAVAQQAAEPTVDEARDQEARALFQAGSTALDGGRFADALGYFERSYELSHRAPLLYNIGIAASTIGNVDRAIEAFQQYLREEPDTDRRQEVDGRLRALEEQRRPSGGGSSAPADSGHGPGAGPWIVIGVSGAALVGGAILFGIGLGANSTVESAAAGTSWPTVSGDYDGGKTFTTVGAILGAVGIAGAAAGVVWLVAGSGGSDSEARVQVSAGLGGVSIGGTF